MTAEDTAPLFPSNHTSYGAATSLNDTTPSFCNQGENATDSDAHRKGSPSGDEIEYPEGGLKAYSVVFGSFCALVAAFGMMNSVGTFQAYIGKHQLANLSSGAVGWIFSIYVALAFFCGAQVGPLFDAKGPRVLLLLGSVLLILSMVLLGFCAGKGNRLLIRIENGDAEYSND